MKYIATILISFWASSAFADIVVPINLVSDQGVGESAGTIRIVENQYGLVFTASLKGLAPGLHGFHLHQNPSCDAKEKDGKKEAAGAAGGHFDPANSAQHGTPWGKGHLGDLPPLYVNSDGSASQPVLAPRLKVKDLTGHALIIHAGGDNHADQPEKLGGGGARVACGVIK